MNAYPDDMPVLVRFPLTDEQERGNREAWPWLAGTVLQQCGPDEWQILVEAPGLETADGFPVCYRDASELRRA